MFTQKTVLKLFRPVQASLFVFLALMMDECPEMVGEDWLGRRTGYDKDTVRKALRHLQDFELVERRRYRKGWALTKAARQLPLPLPKLNGVTATTAIEGSVTDDGPNESTKNGNPKPRISVLENSRKPKVSVFEEGYPQAYPQGKNNLSTENGRKPRISVFDHDHDHDLYGDRNNQDEIDQLRERICQEVPHLHGKPFTDLEPWVRALPDEDVPKALAWVFYIKSDQGKSVRNPAGLLRWKIETNGNNRGDWPPNYCPDCYRQMTSGRCLHCESGLGY